MRLLQNVVSFLYMRSFRKTTARAHILPVFASNINPLLPTYLEGYTMYILPIIFFLHIRISVMIYYTHLKHA